MQFLGTSPWTEEGGGYEFHLSEDGTLVHLHDADIVRADHRLDTKDIDLYFMYDRNYTEGVVRERPVIWMRFANCNVVEWAVGIPSASDRRKDADLSVKTLSIYDGNFIILESVHADMKFTTDAVTVRAIATVPMVGPAFSG